MISGFLKKLFGSRNQRLIKHYQKTVAAINALEPQTEKLTDTQLRAKTDEFRQRVASGESLEALLPEAFAVCREASQRVLNMRHFDVQLIGGMALHDGKIAEMRTGEGKTLVATLAAYLNALSGHGVHIVTVNDYLAKRDAEWMGRLYHFLGLSVGVNLSQIAHEEKRQAYTADITYGTNNEFGFDLLRDNMVYEVQAQVMRGLHFAIVDEVDSILIDEARTPLIISGQAEDLTHWYAQMNALPPLLKQQIGEEKADGTGVEVPGDYSLDEKSRQVYLTEQGHEKAESLLLEWGLISEGQNLYAPQNITLMHYINAALRAHTLYHRDQHYVVQNGEVIIVDEFTGRLMPGRRWSDGLHQAIEAKEKVPIQNENQTMASITFQNYFRMYSKLSGMTGTADTEAYEFQQIYGLETVIIPTNRPNRRIVFQDQVYKNANARFNAVINDIRDCYERAQPVLVGTTSIENSELLSKLLKRAKLPHQVLNAKQHAKEAEIIAQAGRPKVITIATNMAGRGTDIVLGGNVEKQAALIDEDPSLSAAEKARRIQQLHDEWQTLHEQVKAAGGLHIIGTERHESRRIDNQLRGRAARQGDPGSSRFYLALDDPLLRIFAGDRMRMVMERLNMPEEEPIEASMVTRAIESAQRKVEARNFDIRKQLLEYDDVANDQRQVIYQQRNALLESADISETITAMRESVFGDIVHSFVPPGSIEEQWDLPGLARTLREDWQLDLDSNLALNPVENTAPRAAAVEQLPDAESVLRQVLDSAHQAFHAKLEAIGREAFSDFERSTMLQTLDARWREHLAALDHLRQGIHLRGYAQKNPKEEYKREAFALFSQLLDGVKLEVTRILINVQIQSIPSASSLSATFGPFGPFGPLFDGANRPQNIQFQVEFSSNLMNKDNENNKDNKSNKDHPQAQATVITEGKDRKDRKDQSKPSVQQVQRTKKLKAGRNELCPCGSRLRFRHCHGKLL